ncbi:uncharacterized protein V1518DRAFT_421732 [Limtongia smithiae]|uniref:uncharacterized protein n=1 Tax=Limtongia smithiae TaxID=1125753 RepID=UPI0034D0054A
MPSVKKGPKPFDSGVKRSDNRLRQSSFTQAIAINQKNYYTEYLKRDDQAMIVRQLAEELAKAKGHKESAEDVKPIVDEEMEDDKEDEEQETFGSKVIVVHLGSRNMRIGLASDTFPKTIPLCIAYKMTAAEIARADTAAPPFSPADDPEFLDVKKTVSADFRERVRFYKRRMPNNSHDSVVSFNKRTAPESIPDHNDPNRIEWTDVSSGPNVVLGEKALKIPPLSKPRYKLLWPIKNGYFNESDYKSNRQLIGDIGLIIESAINNDLGIPKRDLPSYNAALVISDLYDKVEVTELLELFFKELRFSKVCVLQESVSATFGAGISSACVVDIGAQKTSICCVDDGLCVVDSRVNLPYGGDDITLTFAKLLELSQFPYRDINLAYQYDWTLMEDIKSKFATCNDAEVTVQLYNFYQRKPGQEARKYMFKTFDEVMLAPMSYFFPEIFENQKKLKDRHALFERSTDIYDGTYNDPFSEAQALLYSKYALGAGTNSKQLETHLLGSSGNGTSTPRAGTNKPPSASLLMQQDETPESSVAGTPAPEPAPSASGVGQSASTSMAAVAGNAGSIGGNAATRAAAGPSAQSLSLALMNPQCVICAPLDHAIIESISQFSKADEVRGKRMYENIILVGGGASNIPAFTKLLEDRVSMWKGWSMGSVAVMPTPREMDPTMLVWKGASVFVKLKIATEMWIGSRDWDLLGSRCLQYRCLFLY